LQKLWMYCMNISIGPRWKKDVQKICEQCIACRKTKSRVQPHGLP
jgi:hypothetical protein